LPSARRGGFNKKQQRQSLDENAPESFRGVFVFGYEISAREHDAGVSFWIGGRYGSLLLAIPVAIVASPSAASEERGFYIGGALGEATFADWCVPSPVVLSCDDGTTAWKIFGGYRFNRYFGAEATYLDWGQVSGTVSGVGTVTADQTSFGVAAVGRLELTPQFSVFGKAGLLMTEQETPASSTRKRDETELHYGVGVRYLFTPKWAARAEWERTDQLKVELLSIGLEFRFQ